MTRQIYTGQGHLHFVTFSCNGRRKLLADAAAKQIVIHVLSDLVNERNLLLVGFVIMPNHVHAILHYLDDTIHSKIVQELKRRSSILLRKYLTEHKYPYMEELKSKKDGREISKIWQSKYYDYNIHSEDKLIEKLNYMHENPVNAGLVECAADYNWSSYGHYHLGKSVGVKISAIA